MTKRKLPKNVYQDKSGEWYQYDRTIKGVRLKSRFEFRDPGEAAASLAEAVAVFRETGLTPTESEAARESEKPVDLLEVESAHLTAWQESHPDSYEKMREWVKKADPLILEAGTASNPTFGRLAIDWVFLNLPTSNALSTQRGYRSVLVNHILPTLGPVPVRQLTRLMIKDLLLSKKSKVSKSKIGHIRTCIAGPLSRAVEGDILPANPALELRNLFSRAELSEEDKINPFTAKELSAVLAKAFEMFPWHYPLLLCLARTGMRWGEAVELRWDDIKWSGRKIHIQRAWSPEGEIKKPKSGKARYVRMSQQLHDTLKELRTERKKMALARGWKEVPELVFLSDQGMRLDHGNFYARKWIKLLEKTKGVDSRDLKTLRHTYITLRISAGHDIADVSQQAGHHSVAFTVRVYHHWMPTNRNLRQVDELDDLDKNSDLDGTAAGE